jgi:hypothetical protein
MIEMKMAQDNQVDLLGLDRSLGEQIVGILGHIRLYGRIIFSYYPWIPIEVLLEAPILINKISKNAEPEK